MRYASLALRTVSQLDLTRDHLTTSLDLHNIKHQCNINCMEKDQDDANSVMYWVAEMEREELNPVLCFKNQEKTQTMPALRRTIFFLGYKQNFKKTCL